MDSKVIKRINKALSLICIIVTLAQTAILTVGVIKYQHLKMEILDIETKGRTLLLNELEQENKLLEILKKSRSDNNELSIKNKNLLKTNQDLQLQINVMNEIRPPLIPH